MNAQDRRLETFSSLDDNKIDKHQLARTGFEYVGSGECRCHKCLYVINIDKDIHPSTCITTLHKEESPDCSFAQKLKAPRKKTYLGGFVEDGLRYERTRLDTFIGWPKPWVKPEDLARDGFFFLRTADSCMCVFCFNIFKDWKKRETPRGRHERLQPLCPFLENLPVGNIPKAQEDVLNKLAYSALPDDNKREEIYSDVFRSCIKFTLPKFNFYIAHTKRLASFLWVKCHGECKPNRKCEWPDTMTQTPEEMAEAGFFYGGK